ncbi:MAG: hypothetical protein HY812_00230 [Planctomycetes bacterium]|nr:hypothetical protein [Planctomycetota bacterium]
MDESAILIADRLTKSYTSAGQPLTVLSLSLGATWALAAWRFHARSSAAAGPLLLACAGIILLTLVLGRIGSKGLLARPPLEALRAEG